MEDVDEQDAIKQSEEVTTEINVKVSDKSSSDELVKAREWTREHLSYLAKALSKYPGGTRQRWLCISNALNDWIKPDMPFTPEECAKGANTAIKHLSKPRNSDNSTTPCSEYVATAPRCMKDGGSSCGENSNMVSAVKFEYPKQSHDDWTQSQQKALENGLKKYTADMDSSERWRLIAVGVDGKSSQECLNRYKFLRDDLRRRRENK